MVAHRDVATDRFRIITWNVRGSRSPSVAALAAALRELGADVVALQEVRRSQAREVAAALDWAVPSWLLKHRPWGPLAPRRAEGLAVLSRFDVTREVSACLTPEHGMNTYRRRVMLEVDVASPIGPVRVVNVHLGSEHPRSTAEQARRAAALLGVGAVDADTSRTVLLGDLNAESDPAVLDPLADVGFVDLPSAPTNPAGRASRRIDHVLVGSGLVADPLFVPEDGPAWAALSDHLPVAVTLRRT